MFHPKNKLIDTRKVNVSRAASGLINLFLIKAKWTSCIGGEKPTSVTDKASQEKGLHHWKYHFLI